jgi:hypothetical protein
MAAKKKTKKKQTKSISAVKKKPVAKKKLAKKKPARARTTAKPKALGKTKLGAKKLTTPKKQVRKKSRALDTTSYPVERPDANLAGQSGDLQGLSRREVADSESVDELLEEGNAFEAEVLEGVEDAGDQGVREVHTHEVPEDDVPSEYLDKD